MKEVKHDDKFPNDSQVSLGDEPVEEEQPLDAMSPEVSPGLSLIVQLRTYDVLMALYRHFDQDKADKLVALHEEGKILGPLPYLDM